MHDNHKRESDEVLRDLIDKISAVTVKIDLLYKGFEKSETMSERWRNEFESKIADIDKKVQELMGPYKFLKWAMVAFGGGVLIKAGHWIIEHLKWN